MIWNRLKQPKKSSRTHLPGFPATFSLTDEVSPYDIHGVLEPMVEDLEDKIPSS